MTTGLGLTDKHISSLLWQGKQENKECIIVIVDWAVSLFIFHILFWSISTDYGVKYLPNTTLKAYRVLARSMSWLTSFAWAY